MPRLIVALFFCSILICFACQKSSDGCIRGVVVDAKTNQPLSDASMVFSVRYNERGSLHFGSHSSKTDALGNFEFSDYSGNNSEVSISRVSKKGYSSAFDSQSKGGSGCREVEIRLKPLDAAIKLEVLNETGTQNAIYASVFNLCEYKSWFADGETSRNTSPRALQLQKGEAYTQIFPSCIEGKTAIRWKFSETGGFFKTDTLLVKTADTVVFTIKY